MKDLNDEYLLSRLKDGDTYALGVLYKRYASHVYCFAKNIFSNEDKAADITQSIFLKLWTKKSSIPNVNNLKAYLFKMTRNAIFDSLDRKRESQLEDSHTKTIMSNLQTEIESREVLTIVRLKIMSMPVQRKKIFLMSRFRGLSHKEIASTLNLSEKSVEYHITKANEELKPILNLWK